MRFPKLTELDRDQMAIYQGAPPEGTVLIIGPPGTGKTVIAFHRAHYLSKLGKGPRVVMYNKVLARYTEKRENVAKDVDVSTFHSWVASWWKKSGGHGWPPKVDGERMVHDWDAIRDQFLARIKSSASNRISWGHLIIDEGQDFPSQMYLALKLVMDVANLQPEVTAKMAITVLADENQRLEAGRNSTIEQMRTSLGLHKTDRNMFELSKNYRNTREIAEFASSFYVGLPGGIPKLPSKRHAKPHVSIVHADAHDKFLSKCAEKIARFAKLNNQEIGVFVPGNRDRTKMINRLKARLDGSDIELQSYASGDDVYTADSLEFDVAGRVTVLNFASAKGLEFEAVFVVDPGKLVTGGSSELAAKMTLYVLCSRARLVLDVMMADDEGGRQLQAWIPKDRYELETL